MIEIPRAALQAARIAENCDFFSFGTNDLTQMTFGYSRDDAASFLPAYIEKGILPEDPFASLDQAGVGELVALATKRGRQTSPKLKVGVCGEHGGDPALDRVLPRDRPRLRLLLAVPRARGAPRRRPGRDVRGQGRRLVDGVARA